MVRIVASEPNIVLKLAVQTEECGKVIGANDKTARVLRTIIQANAGISKVELALDIAES
jgi:predicted RNA-binding protein YlqC (UPF0109 family)